MKLTKKLEAEILKIYYTYWESYSKGDVKAFAGTLDKTFEMIGTSESEICHTREEGIKFLEAQIKELVGKVEMRNRKISVVPVNELMLVNERCDIYTLDGRKWIFYSKIRISTFLRKTTSGWKVFQQHGSLPDMRVQEGETLAIKKISKENLQLRDAIKRRTIELEEKNRELEIETALEKVRTVAMGMKRREDMLQICKTISQQLAKLGVKEIRNVQTAIFNVPQGTYMNYEYYAKHNKTFVTETEYTNHKIARAFAAKMLKGRGEVSITYIKGKQKVKEWLNYQKGTNVFIDTYLNTATSLTYYWYSLGPVALGISTYTPLTKDEQLLFSRFLKVFELAYRRYLDIEKAEAQAREAQIEAALERIRAASLAMMDSSALSEIIYKLYGELTKLDAKLDRCFIMIVNQENKGITWWMAGQEGLLAENGFFVQMNQHVSHLMYLDYCKQRKKKWTYLFEGKEKRDWDRFGFSKTELARLPEPVKAFMSAAKKVYLSGSSDQFGSLVTGSFEPLPQEQQEIISRFTIVFNQAYIRFLDLQKAEAQAREAQIEAALERVRSRSMAMHKSDELLEAGEILFVEMQKLGIESLTAGYVLMDKDEKKGFNYMPDPSTKKMFQLPVIIPHNETVHMQQVVENWKKGKPFFIVEMDEEETIKHQTFIAERSTNFTLTAAQLIAISPAKLVLHNFYFKEGYILIVGGTKLSAEQTDIMLRFTKVFQQAYTRFLDLQKAEAQAREAEIQLALERVRARSLAMHHTSELQEVVNIAAQQLHGIGMDINGGVFIAINTEIDKELSIWASGGMADYIQKVIVPELNKPIFTTLRDALRKGNSFLIETFSDKEKREMFTHLFKCEPWKSLPKERKEELLSRKGGFARSVIISHYTTISITNHHGKAFSEEENEILKRFGKVFEQSYIRFLDLQKAEAQAKEAQIEAALEKIRSRSLAMHKSDELKEVVAVLYQKLQELDFDMDKGAAIMITYTPDSKDITQWITDATQTYAVPFSIPFTEYTIPLDQDTAREKGLPIFSRLYTRKEKNEYFRYLFKHTQYSQIPEPVQKMILDSKHFGISIALEKNSAIAIPSTVGKLVTSEEINILKRFSNVFEQSYTRFLDLQKAEAQAQEAQIQLALERVRARTMAMQRSEELPETSLVLYQQFEQLGEPAEQLTIGVVHEENNVIEISATLHGGVLNKIYWHSIDEPFMMNKVYQAWKTQQKTLIVELKGDQLNAYNKYRNELTKSEMFQTDFDDEHRRIVYAAFFSKGMLAFAVNEPRPPQSLELLERFASVFDLTYTRFLDLQKAEAQVREAEIELGLERVRARAMAMQKSDELSDLVDTVFKELTKLDFALNWCIINIIDEPSLTNMVWAANPETNKPPESYLMKFEDYPFHHSMLKGYRERKPKHVYVIEGKEKATYDNYLFNETEWRRVPKAAQDASRAMKRYVATFTFSNFGGLQTVGEEYLSEQNLDILSRFGKVFDLTYTRFNDLLKAEAQAREAQIQLALERARSQSMTMQHSSELDNTLRVFHEQVLQLGIPSAFSFLWLPDEEKERHIFWAAWEEHKSFGSKAINYPLDMNEPATAQCLIDWKSKPVVAYHVPPEGVESYFAAWSELIDDVEHLQSANFRDGLYYVEAFNKYGCFGVLVKNDLDEVEKKILYRFAVEFEQTYTRFLDLQKAEAQAKEAQIEAALERVRSRSMGMQKSEELKEVIKLVYQQLIHLNINLDHAGFVVDYTPKGDWTFWIADEQDIPAKITHPWFESVWANQFNEAKEKDADLFVTNLNFEQKNKFYNELLSYVPGLPQASKDFYLTCPGLAASTVLFDDVALYIENFSGKPYTDEDNKTLMRFGKVFQQTYTRFLDLQKAEAQAREAQIETALEKVRSRSLAMHKSDELLEVVTVIFEQLKNLGLQLWSCGIVRFHSKQSSEAEVWMTRPDGKMMGQSFVIPLDKVPVYKKLYEAWKNMEEFHIESLQDMDIIKHHNSIALLNVIPVDKMKQAAGRELPRQMFFHCINFSDGFLGVITTEAVEDETLLLRFGNTFKQSYTRFLDLQKAEAQAREAQIQLALERVRARTMAMHQSSELNEAAELLYKELTKLGIEKLTCGFTLLDDTTGAGTCYMANPEGSFLWEPFRLNHTGSPGFLSMYESWQKREAYHTFELSGQSNVDHNRYLAEKAENFPIPVEQLLAILPPVTYSNTINFQYGYLLVVSLSPFTKDQVEILKRFAKVFEQTYTRFLDLQKAEAQAREAKIEAALEKVRSRTMGMQHSNELPEAANLLFLEVQALGIPAWSCGYNILATDKKSSTCIMSSEGRLQSAFHLPFINSGEPSFAEWLEAIEKGDFFVQELSGKKIEDHYYYMKTLPQVGPVIKELEDAGLSLPTYQINHLSFFNGGFLLFITYEPVPHAYDIFKRFTTVFEQTYTRFLDLQKAEAQAREAQIETALEKVRSRTLAMQKSDELAETATVLFQQLIALGIEPNRLYIILIKEDSADMEAWVTDEDGSKVSIGFTSNYRKNASLLKMYKGWKEKRNSLVIDMQGEELKEYFHYLHNELHVPFKGGLEQKRRVQHIAYFSHGLIGMASPDEQPVETLQLLERFAAVFNLTFTRFNDLQVAEAHALQAEQDLVAIKEAKQKAEEALAELQVTQKQLIQSEKMASLGELTAGIAHEIQNPLNFVNNFSEVSKELLDEMKEAIEKGDTEDAREIMNDVIQNLEKINHHGKRADGIVKGMLQHSRSSSGQKEPTDINALADEYLRLAYHGLRAKDKSFNATMITDYDAAIGNINVIPQDMGRVILNLITNAFYVVAEKKKENSEGYEPTVSVSTKNEGNNILISVRDNGNGIPQKILDKIFQPFFTTKPTGQGTGLGLSLSYDIVKAHGGELKVETKERKGTIFIISLPIHNL